MLLGITINTQPGGQRLKAGDGMAPKAKAKPARRSKRKSKPSSGHSTGGSNSDEEELIRMLGDSDSWVRGHAVAAIEKLRPDNLALFAPALAHLLDDDDHNLRVAAVMMLGGLDPADLCDRCGSALLLHIGHSDWRVRGFTRLVLGKREFKDLEPHAAGELVPRPHIWLPSRASRMARFTPQAITNTW